MIISVASGKGGTGKTMVATSLALSLSSTQQVQFLDCDVEEPNAHIFLKPEFTDFQPTYIRVPVVDSLKCTYCGKCREICIYNAIAVLPRRVMVLPHLCHGCGACSYLCPQSAISESGKKTGVISSGYSKDISFIQGRLDIGEALPVPVVKEVKRRADSEGTVIIDAPPGTSCQMVQSVINSDFCLLVTEPTPFGFNDLKLAVEVVRELKIPFGVVINRTGIGDSQVTEHCKKEKIPVLLSIPLDANIARLYSRGINLVEEMPEWGDRFIELFDMIRERISERAGSVKR